MRRYFLATGSLPIACVLLLGLVACGSPVNTVPAPLAPADPIQYYELEIPESLDVTSVDFDATTFAHVSGTEYGTGSKIGGRAFVKVHAIHRKTGDQYLLIYEDVLHRKRPVQIIRLQGVPDAQLLPPNDG